MFIDPSIFKAYDIRGVYPTQINAEIVYKIAQAYAKFISPKTVVVGTDMRLSGQEFKQAASQGLIDAGVNVLDIGLSSSDMFYFAVVYLGADGGMMATASHNPKEYGGLKLVKAKSMPLSGNSGIYEIRDLVIHNQWSAISHKKGAVINQDVADAYFEHVLKPFNLPQLRSLKVVANTNFGMATVAVQKLTQVLPVQFLEVINGRLDGNFPKGRPDPLRPETRSETVEVIRRLKPDLGVAWDADADRCFFFDESGQFVTPAYVNALLSEYYLKKYPGGKILHDTRVYRVIDHAVKNSGGVSIPAVAGHSFIKERMVKEQAVFGSETSGHYYFKDNFYLDNGLMPFLAMLEILSQADQPFSEILKPLREQFYISEEINFEFKNPDILANLKAAYNDAKIDELDGLDICYPSWRVSVRKSNTENLLRINVEADSAGLLSQKISEVSSLINQFK